MTIILYHSPHTVEAGSTWTVTRGLMAILDPMVVRFHKQSRSRTLLDRNARWSDGWDPDRWIPRPPAVPQWLLDHVEDALRQS